MHDNQELRGFGSCFRSVKCGGVAEWSNATGCKPVDLRVYAGSNPAPSKPFVRTVSLVKGPFEKTVAKLRNRQELEIIALFGADFGVCGSSSVGRVVAFQAIGRGFESRLPLQTTKK